jgi:cell division control protein 45
MLAGIPLAQQLHRAVVRTGSAIIDERAVKTLKTFRLIVLKDTPDLSLFQHPLTLCKLAMFMVNAMRETGKGHLPLVIASLVPASNGDVDSDTYLIVGLPAAADGQQNKYVLIFNFGIIILPHVLVNSLKRSERQRMPRGRVLDKIDLTCPLLN